MICLLVYHYTLVVFTASTSLVGCQDLQKNTIPPRGGSSRKFLGPGLATGRYRLSSARNYNRATTQGQLALRNLNKACTRKTQQYNH